MKVILPVILLKKTAVQKFINSKIGQGILNQYFELKELLSSPILFRFDLNFSLLRTSIQPF